MEGDHKYNTKVKIRTITFSHLCYKSQSRHYDWANQRFFCLNLFRVLSGGFVLQSFLHPTDALIRSTVPFVVSRVTTTPTNLNIAKKTLIVTVNYRQLPHRAQDGHTLTLFCNKALTLLVHYVRNDLLGNRKAMGHTLTICLAYGCHPGFW